MSRGLALLIAALLLSACVAETVERRRPRKGPIKEVGYVEYGGGRVRYSAVGWGPAVASRRRMALKLMSNNCGPDLEPRIVDEYARQDADAPYSGSDVQSSMDSGGQHYVIERYVHLTYECVPRGAQAPAPAVAVSSAPVPSSSTLVSPEPPK